MKRDFDKHYDLFDENDLEDIKHDALSHNSFLQADKTVVVKKVVKSAAKGTPK
jgi:cathepsin H/xylem cysteine proteinase